MLGNIQVEVLKYLHKVKFGVQIEELFKFWRYKEGAEKSLESLQKMGYIKIINGQVFFVSYPKDIKLELSSTIYSQEELIEFENITRRNLVYTYKEELLTYIVDVKTKRKLPEGVKRSLQRLGVLKWKILELTELGRKILLTEIQTTQLS
ncbi:hypothetical protein JW865_01415 [Candidatus Bathyarchaeota archaeon]|nr:hypothetical protein [Candidatus Bathyarchaeota archaeon]